MFMPPFADNSEVIVKRAVVQLETSTVTLTVTLLAGAILPSGRGNEPWIIGAHTAPLDCENVTRVSCAALAAPGPVLLTLKCHTCALLGALFPGLLSFSLVGSAIRDQ
jgi:hypothetical protein